MLSGSEPPTTLVELTIEALENRAAARDWEYVVCTCIRAWEKFIVQACLEEGLRPRGAMAWYDWRQICKDAFNQATEDLDPLADAVRIDGGVATNEEGDRLHKLGRRIARHVADACSRTWVQMNRRLWDRGLPVFAPCSATTQPKTKGGGNIGGRPQEGRPGCV